MATKITLDERKALALLETPIKTNWFEVQQVIEAKAQVTIYTPLIFDEKGNLKE